MFNICNLKGFKHCAIRALFFFNVIFLFWNISFIIERKVPSNDQLKHELSQEIKVNLINQSLLCPAQSKLFKFDEVECFQFPKSNVVPVHLFEEVLESSRQPTRGNTIFFIDTACAKDGAIHMSPRQACAVESAALHHPNRDIFVLIAAPVGYPEDERLLSPVVKSLQKYPNIHFRHVNVQKYVMNTLVQKWFETGKIFTSKHMNVHLSDFLRLLTMYRFGGTYFDSDYIIFHNLDKLQPGFFGRENDQIVGNSVMNFSPDGIGHEMTSLILQEFAEKFDGTDWSANGPTLFTRVAKRICRTNNFSKFSRERCVGFDVHHNMVFYPLEAGYWKLMFYEKSTESILNKTKDAMAVHMWGALSRDFHQKENEPKSAYSILAKKHCPVVNALNLNIFESV